MGCGNSSSTNVKPLETTQPKQQERTLNLFIKENDKKVSDNYIIKNKLGEGAFGQVRRVLDNKTGEEKALKIIKKSTSDKDQESKLMKEVDILRSIDHPSSLKMYEFYQDKKNFYIITEVIKGGELFDKIVDLNSFSEVDAAYIFHQLISVVQYVHEKNIMHRDLKPDNILLEYNPNSKDSKFSIKVIDWGSATCFTDKRETDQIGTPYYISPEVLKRSYNEKCDIWTCGVILYVMLTGEPPFYGSNNEIMHKIIQIQYDMDQDTWKNISSECKDLIKQMICPEDKRLTAKQVQDHPWVKKYTSLFKDESKDSVAQKDKSKLQLTKLKKFNTKNRLHQAVLSFLATQLASKEDLLEFKQMFEKMDKNNDGNLTKEEIEQGFKQHQQFFHGDYDVEKIFQNVDLDGNGKINYTEFVTASVQHESNLVDSKLQQAFDNFDTDKNKLITKDEIQEIFGFNQADSEKQIKEILQQFDSNGDGNISFDEFKAMMKKYAENH